MSIRQKTASFALSFFVCGLLTAAEDQKIYRGSDVPEGWNGDWPAELLTVPEKTDYTRTTSSYDIQERLVRIRHRLHHVDRTRRPPRTPRLRLEHTFSGDP